MTAAWALDRAGAGLAVPDGLREEIHYHCGKPTWLGVLAPESRRLQLERADWVVSLAPRPVPGGDAVLHRMTNLVVITPFGDGNLTLHRCPARVRRCPSCDGPVRYVGRQLGKKVKIQKLDASESDDGWYVVGDDGLAVLDRHFELTGPRFRPHQCPRTVQGRSGPDGRGVARRRPETAPLGEYVDIPGQVRQGPEKVPQGL